jgi:lipid A disaccharide synthetase
MVNLIAGRRIVPELMQRDATGEKIALEANGILSIWAPRGMRGSERVERCSPPMEAPQRSSCAAVIELIQ